MDELLFLAHRIPYPPNKGDKIRSFHILEHLARRYRVHLGTFVDDPRDWAYVEDVRARCVDSCIVPLRRGRALMHGASGFLAGSPLTLGFYHSPGLHAWVRRLRARETVKRVLVFSSAMAQYVRGDTAARRVMDFVDIDSDKWRQYAARHRGPMCWLYTRESKALLAYERAIAAEFDASLFVSAAEADMFRTLAPESAGKIDYFENGVDADYFSPATRHEDPYDGARHVLVFTGAMDYWANVDAVRWFAEQVFPAVRKAVPDARFYVVGARPVRAVMQLAGRPGVHVIGSVPDVRPYLAWARAAVAPLRVARGVQNKVLEALAMARPVLATPQALDGLRPANLLRKLECRGAEEYAGRAAQWLTGTIPGHLGECGREYVLREYDWQRNLERLGNLLEGNARESTTGAACVCGPGAHVDGLSAGHAG
jgi:sugar transferase (PEP-CTERM/EpsH1 system associated)